jgi:septal ring factor EnvC (AmiA/AmiB activator)
MAAVPAVALAATDDDNETTKPVSVTEALQTNHRELRKEARTRLDTAVERAKAERREKREARRKRALAKERQAGVPAAPAGGASPQLEAIAACESGGDPTAIGGGGAYRGKYQFDYQTWASVGGSGDPAAAPEAEQDARAAALMAQSGSTPWPVCGQ